MALPSDLLLDVTGLSCLTSCAASRAGQANAAYTRQRKKSFASFDIGLGLLRNGTLLTLKRCFQRTQVLQNGILKSTLTSLTPRSNALYVDKMQGFTDKTKTTRGTHAKHQLQADSMRRLFNVALILLVCSAKTISAPRTTTRPR